MLRRSKRIVTPRSVEDSPVPLTSDDKLTGSSRKGKINKTSFDKGKDRQIDSIDLPLPDLSSLSSSSSSSPAPPRSRREVQSDIGSNVVGRSARSSKIGSSTGKSASRRPTASTVSLTTKKTLSSIYRDVQTHTSRRPISSGQNGSLENMESDEDHFSRESSVEIVSVIYATQPPPTYVRGSSINLSSIFAAPIKNEALSQRPRASKRKTADQDARPTMSAAVTIGKKRTKKNGRIMHASETENTGSVSGQLDWLASPPSQPQKQNQQDTLISQLPTSMPHVSSSESSASRSSTSFPDPSATVPDVTQAHASQNQSMPNTSLHQSNANLTRSPSGRPRPRPNAAAIASSISASRNDFSPTNPGSRPKPRPSAEAIRASTQASIAPISHHVSPDCNFHSAISTEDSMQSEVQKDAAASISHASNVANEDHVATETAPQPTMQLRSRTARKRSPTVITVDDSLSSSPPPPKRPAATQSNVGKRGRGRPKKAARKPASKSGKKALPILAIQEREKEHSPIEQPQSPEVPIRSSIRPPQRRKRRKSLTPEEEEQVFSTVPAAAQSPPHFLRDSGSKTIQPAQSQRPRPRALQRDSDDEPDNHQQEGEDMRKDQEREDENRSIRVEENQGTQEDEDQGMRNDRADFIASSSSSPLPSSSPPSSSSSSYASALESQRRTAGQEIATLQVTKAPPLFIRSTEANASPMKIHVPLPIANRDLLLQFIHSGGAQVCNGIERCDVVIVDDQLLESKNGVALATIRKATNAKDPKPLVRATWLQDSVKEGKMIDQRDTRYAISKEDLELVMSKPSSRLYNIVPNHSVESLASLRLVPGKGGHTRIAFTETDAVQIVEHLAITKEAWDGTLCAKELEIRFKRHTWMSYQSHLRDNLTKNKHYSDRVKEYQRAIGQEKLILVRRKMLGELYGEE